MFLYLTTGCPNGHPYVIGNVSTHVCTLSLRIYADLLCFQDLSESFFDLAYYSEELAKYCHAVKFLSCLPVYSSSHWF